jgi:hypothetical protein
MHGVTGTRVIDTPNPNHSLTLHGYQADLVLNRTARVLVLQGGQGCGKTKALLVFLFLRILEQKKAGGIYGIVAPTYGHLRRTIVKKLQQEAQAWGLHVRFLRGDMEFLVEGKWATIQMISGEDPERIAGTEWDAAGMDEPASMTMAAYKETEGRLRGGNTQQQLILTGTPRGRKTIMEDLRTRAEAGDPSILFRRGRTRDNIRNLGEGFVSHLENVVYANDPVGMQNFLEGTAADVAGKRVYPAFTAPTVPARVGGRLVVGQDFNVHWQTSVIMRWDAPSKRLHVLGDFTSRKGDAVVPVEVHMGALYRHLQERGWMTRAGACAFTGEKVLAYVDNSAGSYTAVQAVRQAGFTPRGGGKNPIVTDRVANTNHALATGALTVGPEAHDTIRALQEHTYDGETEKPKKRYGVGETFQADHYTDALGYVAWYLLPMHATLHGRREAVDL